MKEDVSNKIVFSLPLTLSLSKGMVRQAHHERLLHDLIIKVE